MANNPTVLVVNDDPVQLRLTGVALGRDGFDVWSCADAEQALRGMEDGRKADIGVTDLYMPGIDGWRLCRLLRSAAFARLDDTPILAVSSIFSGSDAEQLTAQLGADGFLAEPFVRELVRAHGGAVDVVSAPGKGSCYSVSLPLVDAQPESVSGEDSAVSSAEMPIRVSH